MTTALCPPGSLQHFQAAEPFQLAVLIQLLSFPQTSGDFSNPKVTTVATEITIKGNSLIVSKCGFPVGLCLPLGLQWPQPEGRVTIVTTGPKLAPSQNGILPIRWWTF